MKIPEYTEETHKHEENMKTHREAAGFARGLTKEIQFKNCSLQIKPKTTKYQRHYLGKINHVALLT